MGTLIVEVLSTVAFDCFKFITLCIQLYRPILYDDHDAMQYSPAATETYMQISCVHLASVLAECQVVICVTYLDFI